MTQRTTKNHRGPQRNTGCIPPWSSVLLRAPLCPSLALAIIAVVSSSCNQGGPSPPRTPEEELATFQVEPDLKIQLIASEPMVEDPVFITFDEDGKLWVVEMRGFMPDVDGNGEEQKTGRVSILQDTTGDGVMDKSTVFLDSLIMPRALAVVAGGALVVEDQKLWFAADADHNLLADSKTLVDAGYGGPPMPEHSPNGLWRGLDNWYYNAKSSFRYRLIGGAWKRDTTEFRGQWGMSHDDEGRLFYNYNWSQLHADLVPPDYLSRNPHHTPTTGIDHGVTSDRRVYPIRSNPAVNRGYIPGTLDAQGRLLEFTAACSPFVYRGTALPKEFYGNAFVAEPSGNLVKRNVVVENGVTLSAHDPHPGKEFLASTDERFRPVSIASGPDGALYITDMYRGLVQHKLYVTPYLREQSLKRKLVQPIHHGRIWRIVPEKWENHGTIRLSDLSSTKLIDLLGDGNGWTRDMAQRIIVERADQSITDQLELAMKSGNDFQRLHAIWTLEGIGTLTSETLFTALGDEHHAVSNSALRLLEPFAAADRSVRQRLGPKLLSMYRHADYVRQLQYVLSSSALEQQARLTIVSNVVTQYADSALMRDAVMSAVPGDEIALLRLLSRAWNNQSATQGKEIFIEMLSSCIVRTRQRNDIAELLNLSQSKNRISNSILTGITTLSPLHPPIRLSNKPAILSQPGLDPSRILKLSQMFEWPGYSIDTSAVAKRKLSERDQQRFADGRKLYLTSCASCHGTDGAGMQRLGPTLIGSEWVLGDERRLALLVLHGIEGPIEVKGKTYDVPDILPVMPSHSTMDDGAITSILTYIRNEWGNDAGAVGPRTVGRTRHLTQGRVMPWTAKELNEHMTDSTTY